MPTPPFQPNKPEYRAVFEACYALAQMAGTPLPDINTEPDWQIRKKGCAAIVALQLAGIPTSSVIAQLQAQINALVASLSVVAFSGDYNDLLNKPELSGGTVKSVQLSVPGFLNVTSAPITVEGTIQAVLATKTANTVLAGPTSGPVAIPTFRAIVPADILLPNDKILIGVNGFASATKTSVYNIVAYGADPGASAAANNTAISDAITAAVADGGGTIYVPEGIYVTTELTVSSSVGITFLFADRFSSILKASLTTAPVMTITGSNVTLKGGGFDGAYVAGASSGTAGIISISNANNITIDRCVIQNGLRNGIMIFGDCTGISILSPYLYRNYCGIRSFPDVPNNKVPQKITVRGGEIISNWDRTGNDQTGGIKLANDNGVTIESSGHLIDDVYISAAGCLAVELWAGNSIMSNSTVSNMRIFGVDSADKFGISLMNCRNSNVLGGTIRMLNAFVGVEIANGCQQCSVNGPNINLFAADGTTTSSGTAIGIFNNSGPAPAHTKISNVTASGGDFGLTTQNTITTTEITNCTFRKFAGSILTFSNSSYIKAVLNTLEGPCAKHIFIDAPGINVTDIEVAYNTFIGDAGERNVFGYNNSTAFTLTNFHFHHNNAVSSTFTLFDSWTLAWDAGEMINVVRENNYYVAGANKTEWPYWASADVPAPPFDPNIQEFSIPIASKFTFSVAANAGDQWFKIFSRTEGLPLTFALHVECDFLATDNTAASQTFWVASSPYGQSAGIMKLPDGGYNAGSLKGIIYNNAGGADVQEVWLRFPATGGGTVTVGGADFASSWILAPSAVTVEPTWNANKYELSTQTDFNTLQSRYMATDQLKVVAGGYVNFGATGGTSGYGFRDNAGTMEVKDSGGAWAPFGTAAVTSIIGTANEIAASSPTGAVTLSLPTALTFTGKTVTGGTFNITALTVNAAVSPVLLLNQTGPTSNNTNFGFQRSGVSKGFVGTAGDTNGLVTGAAQDDMVFRSQGKDILFSVDSGSSIMARFSSTGLAVTGDISLTGALKLGNAYVAGAVTPTGTLTLKDSSGTVYRVPCLV